MPLLSGRARAALLALTAFALFSTHDLIIKALGGYYAPQQIVFFSALMGFPLLMVMLIRDGAPGTLRPVHPWWTALRSVCVAVTGFATFYAFSVLPMAQVYALVFAAPLLITVLSIPILGESVGVRRLVAVAIGLSGVIVVLQPGAAPLSLGHLAGVTAAVSGALGSVVVRRIGRDERGAVLLVFPMMTNIVIMGAMLPFVYRPMPVLHLGALAAIAALAFLASNFLIAAYRNGEAVVVAPMQYSQIVWATAFGAILFGEAPGFWVLVGGSIIVASGIYIVLREERTTRTTSRPVQSTRSRSETGTHPRVGVIMRQRPGGRVVAEPWDR